MPREMIKAVASVIREYVATIAGPLQKRIDDLDAGLAAIPAPLKGDPGEQGDPGKSVTIAEIEPLVAAAVAALPTAKDGRDGIDGKSGVILLEVEPLVTAAVAALPKPKDGLPGKDGRNAFEIAVSLGFEGDVYAWQESLCGKGKDGTSVTVEQVLPALQAEMQKAIAALPVPPPGKDSTVTAEDFRTLFEAESAKALLDFERRVTDRLDRIEKPRDGKDGRDGFGLEDFQSSMGDDGRTLTLAFVRGDVRKEFSFRLKHPIYRGIWKQGDKYLEGDSVTYGGSTWIAVRDTDSKPETDDSFRLAVKRGRDGKDGEKGDRGEPGPPAKR